MKTRPARADDLDRLTEIYNHYVTTTHVTFDVQPFDVAGRRPWFERFDGDRYQCWVAEEDALVHGYACSMPFKEKAAYQTSVEVSIYLAPECVARGTGRRLYEVLLPELRRRDLHRAYAGIAQPNEPSMKLHQALGFTPAARYTEVGRKFDRYWDVVWLELKL